MSKKNKLKAELILEVAQLQKGVKELEDIFNLSPDMVGVFTTEGKLLKVNPAWEEILGYKQNELLESGWVDLVHPDDVEPTNKVVEKQLEGSSVVNFVNRYKCTDGSYKTLEWQASYAKEGIVYATARDITEAAQLEEHIRLSEARFRCIFSEAPIGIELYDSEGNLVDANQECLDIFGIENVDEIRGFELFEDLNISEELKTELSIGQSIDFESEFDFEIIKKLKLYKTTKSGKYCLSVQIAPYEISDLGEKGYIVHVKDITKRVQAETILLTNQYYLTKAQEMGVIGTWELDIQKDILKWTDENYKIFGVPLGTDMNLELFLNCIHPEDRDYVAEKWNAGLNHEPYDIEHRIIVNNEVRWVREKAEVEFDQDSNPILAIGFTQDITERIQDEEKLRESERLLKETQILGGIGRWEYEIDSQIITWDDQVFKLYERDPSLGEPTFEEEAAYYHPEDSARLQEYSRLSIAERKSFDYDVQVLLPSGKSSYMTAVMKPITDESDRVVKLVGIIQDITERKLVEGALQASETLLNDTQQLTKVGGWKWNLENKSMFWTDETYRIHEIDRTKIDPGSLKHIERSINCYDEKDRHTILEAFRKCADEGLSYDLEFPFTTVKGNRIWIRTTARAEKENDKVVGVIGTTMNITERVLANEEIRFHAAMMKNVAEGIYLVGLDDFLIKWTNEKFSKMFGYDPDEMVGKQVDLVNAPTERTPSQTRESIADVLNETGEWHGEVRNIKRDGTHFWCYANVSLFDHPEYGKVMIAAHTDITERVRADMAVRESEEKFRNLFNHSEVGMFRTRLDGTEILDTNDKFLEIFDYTRDEMQGAASVIHWADPREREEMKSRLQVESRLRDFECGMLTKKGEERRCLASLVLYPEQGILEGSIIDITDRVQAEQEKDQLLEQVQVANQRLMALSRELIRSQEEERKRISQELHDDLGQALTAISLDLNIIERDLSPDTSQDIKKRLKETKKIADDLDQKICGLPCWMISA